VKVLIAILTLGICVLQGSAQDRNTKSKEIGIVLGTAYYMGDINYRHFGGVLSPGGGLLFRNNLDKRWSFKTSLLYGKIEAHDSDSDDAWQRNRNLHFRNEIIEFSAQMELNYLDYQIGSDDIISPYLFLGLSYYSSNPKAEYNDNWYELQPLGTEGQGTTLGEELYRTSGVAIPMGAGLKVNVYRSIAINLEWGMRRTYSDYIDDVSGTYIDPVTLLAENGRLALALADRSLVQSGPDGTNAGVQRGDPGRRDWYSFANFTLSFRVDKRQGTCWK